MSQSHIRVQPAAPPSKTPRWLQVSFPIVILAFFIGPGVWILSRPPFDPTHEVAPGRVLESRIATVSVQDGGRYTGGSLIYQVRVHVNYYDHGKLQDRWMPGSDQSTSREWLQTRINLHPQTCQVYWLAEHPENPRCRFD